MKKVLIITYYWIPSGGSGVQRWVKFCKYLREFGWDPIIYTPENPEYPSVDYSFEKDIPADVKVIKTPIWEPYNVYRKLTHKKYDNINAGFISEKNKQGWKDKVSVWIRGNFLIPDPRCFWIRPSIRYLTEYLKEYPVDAIITTGPPQSMHLIGLGLKKKFTNLPWISDFRDPWTNIFFYKDLKVNFIADRIQHRLEKKVVRSADTVLVVSQGMKDEFGLLNPKKLQIISNGFDTDDNIGGDSPLDSKFTISHIGLLTPKQNPLVLWKVLSELCFEDTLFQSDLEIQLIGKVDFLILESISQSGLQKQLVKIPYLPHHEAIAKQQCSQILLLLLINEPGNKCILTGKLFEYLAAKRPVLAFGPTDGDAATVLNKTMAGVMIDFDDETSTKELIRKHYSEFKAGKLSVQSSSLEQYTRRNLTEQLSNVLDSLL